MSCGRALGRAYVPRDRDSTRATATARDATLTLLFKLAFIFLSLNFIYISNLTLDPYIFHYSPDTPTRLSRTLKSRFTVPPTLNGFETRRLVDACQSNEPVHNSGKHRDFPELHTEDRCHQVEMSAGHQSPVERADHHEDGCENV